MNDGNGNDDGPTLEETIGEIADEKGWTAETVLTLILRHLEGSLSKEQSHALIDHLDETP